MRVLSIAGFDPSGGAGILLDSKVFTLLGLFSSAVPTCLTIQTPSRFLSWNTISPQYIYNTLFTLISDINFQGIKIGMIGSEDVLEVLEEFLDFARKKVDWIVCDPVLRATLGRDLFSGKQYTSLFKKKILKFVDVLTPNLEELKALSGREKIEEGAKELFNLGVKSLIVTGVKRGDQVLDMLFYEDGVLQLEARALELEFHGTGCGFSSALLAFLVKGYPLEVAFKKAKNWLYLYLKRAAKKGFGGKLWVYL